MNARINDRNPRGRVPDGAWKLLFLGGLLLLGGCATSTDVKQASSNAQLALANSQKANAAVAKEQQARQALAKDMDTRLKALGSGQAQLRRQLVANEARLARDEAKLQTALVRAEVKMGTDQATASPLANTTSDFMSRLIEQVRVAARKPYQAPPTVSPVLTRLDFSRYQALKFKGQVPGWSNVGPLTPNFYPAGYLFHHPVKIYLLAGNHTVPLEFSAADFNFDAATAKELHGPVPLAGFSVYYPFQQGPNVNEFISFLGASYFRALGRGQDWGLSARGLAVDTAIPHQLEEFPYFKAFWIVPPKPGASVLSFYAQLDSPSFTGAYHFVVHPGDQTLVDVDMVLFTRKSVRRLGIAPLTSMFLQGRDGGTRFDPLVRAAHDSDGLSIEVQRQQWIWVPLQNPKRLMIESIPVESIKGFGLMQRARKYDDYQAWGMAYEKRPSAWVTPLGGDWAKGKIMLVELPTRTQNNDNITAFWEPAQLPKPGQELQFKYQIAWQGNQQTLPSVGHVVSTRLGRVDGGDQTCVVNFRGPALDALPEWVHIQPSIQVDGPAKLVKAWVAKNPATGNWRLEFSVHDNSAQSVRVRARLIYDKRVLTETWDAVLPRS